MCLRSGSSAPEKHWLRKPTRNIDSLEQLDGNMSRSETHGTCVGRSSIVEWRSRQSGPSSKFCSNHEKPELKPERSRWRKPPKTLKNPESPIMGSIARQSCVEFFFQYKALTELVRQLSGLRKAPMNSGWESSRDSPAVQLRHKGHMGSMLELPHSGGASCRSVQTRLESSVSKIPNFVETFVYRQALEAMC